MNYDKCTGCRVCEKVCPKNAISFSEKWLGFLYPVVSDKCIHCGLCEKLCPANNIKPLTVRKCYTGLNPDEIRLKSSSGGIFAALASEIIKRSGVVFGAVFDQNWNVIIEDTENDISKMLGSKYVQADVGRSYEKCKEFLDIGREVLYTGTPCQIYALKSFLKKEYTNLLTVDIFCHGVPSPKVWRGYLDSFNKEIESVNFRDKRSDWENFHLTIKFKDGSEISESKSKNYFMQLFLQNKILRKSCYNCQHRSHSNADISIGDAWGQDSKLKDGKGLSSIVIHTEKGEKFIHQVDLNKELSEYQKIVSANCIDRNYEIPKERRSLISFYSDNKNIAIVTDQVHQNIGGILQAVALSDKVEELTGVKPHFVNQKNNGHKKFFDDNCEWTTKPITNETHMIVGSDQIWNRRFCRGVPFEDKFLIHDNIHKIVYAASFGHHNNEYTCEELDRIRKSLSKVKYISTREISGTILTENWFNAKSVSVLDPTLLYDKEYYLNKIKVTESSEDGIFAYILDNNPEWVKVCEKLAKDLNTRILPFDNTCEGFISNFNKAKYVITDSFHGSVFSLIFNKPFICLRNMKRGNDRFDDLTLRFDIAERFVENLNQIKPSLLENRPSVGFEIREFRKTSIAFLKEALFNP